MEEMKATLQNGRSGGKQATAHNGRVGKKGKAEHIDETKSMDNLYLAVEYNETDTGAKLRRVHGEDLLTKEMDYYDRTFGAAVDAQYARYKKKGQKDRMKTATREAWYTDSRKQPDEQILQIGDYKNYKEKNELRLALNEYLNDFVESFTKKDARIRPLDFAFHTDETSDHVHFRYVYEVKDKDGHWTPNQTECLKRLGFERPHPDKPEGKYNNVKQPFTDKERELWYNAIERSLDVKINRESISHKHHQKIDHELGAILQQIQGAEAILDAKSTELSDIMLKIASEGKKASEIAKMDRQLTEAIEYLKNKAIDPMDISTRSQVNKQVRQLAKAKNILHGSSSLPTFDIDDDFER